jgi:hypothetical protein
MTNVDPPSELDRASLDRIIKLDLRVRDAIEEFARQDPDLTLAVATLNRAVVAHLQGRPASGIFWCAVPNGGYRSKTEAAIMVGLGVRKGSPDLICVKASREASQVYALELKAPRGRLSPAQMQCHEELRRAGAVVAVCHSLDDALDKLELWGVLRGRRT